MGTMADEKKSPKTETLFRVEISNVSGLPEWKTFEAKSKAFENAKQELMAAKRVVREMLRTSQSEVNIHETADIDFSISGSYVVVTHNLEQKQAQRPRSLVVSLNKTASLRPQRQ